MENVYIQYNSPIPILLPVSMNHLAERGQMLARVLLLGFLADKFSCRRFVNLLQTNLSAIDSQDIDGLHLKRARMPSIPFRRPPPFHHRGVNKWRSMRRCLSSSSWYKQSHQYPRCQWGMNGHCRKTSNHEPMIQLLLLLRAVCPIISCYLMHSIPLFRLQGLLYGSFIRSGLYRDL